MRWAFLGLAVAALTALGVAAPSSAVLGQAKQVTQGHISAAEVLALPEASATGQTGLLAGISAVSPSNIWAVGSYTTSSGAERTLVMHWNGTAWTKVASPSPGPTRNSLSAVTAVSSSDAWAAGYYYTSTGLEKTLVMHWNGTAWTKVASPSPGPTRNSLSAVTAVSSSDIWAVGGYATTSSGAARTLVLHWNGTAWTKVASPNPGSGSNLQGVSALSPSDAWAAGSYITSTGTYRTLVLHWNGSAWTKVASPNPSSGINSIYFGAVSALSPSDAWAVGYYYLPGAAAKTLVLHWNGTAWTKVASPNPGSGGSTLNAVSALSPSAAWAVGGYFTTAPGSTFVLHWNGTAWTKVASPNPSSDPASGGNFLNAVSALSPSDAWAVGVYYTSTGPGKTLVLHWNGTAWTRS